MKAAAPASAAAVFDGTQVAWGSGRTAEPRCVGERLTVAMQTAGAAPQEYQLTYFLGHRPIEQHIASFPNGKLQALPIGFDTVRREWFDIFAADPRQPEDWGYWTNAGMTANTRCLYCHTTGYEKGYVAERDGYETRWAEMGVGCEACHGPGQQHVARRRARTAVDDRYAPVKGAQLHDLCATCHARRREIAAGFKPGDRFLDFFEPMLLDGPEYYVDGQIHNEDYEWTSFLQSRMAQRGVTCLDCHNVHGTGLLATGNQLCLRCHDAQLASPAHLHHAPDSPGAQCVSCHMPETTYMARDPRRDHAFTLPDPQATVELAIPNACSRCHAAQGAPWATEHVDEWYGKGGKRKAQRERAQLFAQARRGESETVGPLLECVQQCSDVIRRASAARLLSRFVEHSAVTQGLTAAAASGEPLVRWSAVWALADAGASDNPAIDDTLRRAAGDPVRTVRLEAAWGLRGIDLTRLSETDRTVVAAALADWERSAAFQAEYPEAEQSRGVFYAARGDTSRAEAAYRRALQLAPDAVPPRYNLALLLVEQGRTADAEQELVKVCELDPGFAPAAYALGLVYGNAERWREAVKALSACVKADPTYPGALHNLAHAYVRLGQRDIAMTVLEAAVNYPGARTEALRALVSVSLEGGDRETARRWARVASAEDPEVAADRRVQEILRK